MDRGAFATRYPGVVLGSAGAVTTKNPAFRDYGSDSGSDDEDHATPLAEPRIFRFSSSEDDAAAATAAVSSPDQPNGAVTPDHIVAPVMAMCLSGGASGGSKGGEGAFNIEAMAHKYSYLMVYSFVSQFLGTLQKQYVVYREVDPNPLNPVEASFSSRNFEDDGWKMWIMAVLSQPFVTTNSRARKVWLKNIRNAVRMYTVYKGFDIRYLRRSGMFSSSSTRFYAEVSNFVLEDGEQQEARRAAEKSGRKRVYNEMVITFGSDPVVTVQESPSRNPVRLGLTLLK
jgi:hypothetical protein